MEWRASIDQNDLRAGASNSDVDKIKEISLNCAEIVHERVVVKV